MAKVKFPNTKPNDSNGLTKRGIDGSVESQFSNVGGDKGAKQIKPISGRLKIYKQSVTSLNTGSIDGGRRGLGDANGLGDRNDA